MPNPDLATAARRLAEWTREAQRTRYFNITVPDLVTLLPILDAVAAMPETDEARVERMTGVIIDEMRRQEEEATVFGLDYFDPEIVSEAVVDGRVDLVALARAAIALADAERAAAVPDGIEQRAPWDRSQASAHAGLCMCGACV